MSVAGGQIVQQFDAGAARGAQSRDADMCARHARQTLLFDAPVLALADDAQPEPVAVERKAALGVGGGDRGVVDAEKQPVRSCQRGSPLPGGYWINSSGCRSGSRKYTARMPPASGFHAGSSCGPAEIGAAPARSAMS